MTLQRLASGYWHARWSSEIWAQWPIDREPREEDFFHASSTPERIREAADAAANEHAVRPRSQNE